MTDRSEPGTASQADSATDQSAWLARHGITVVLVGTLLALAAVRYGLPGTRRATPVQPASTAIQSDDDSAWSSAVADAAQEAPTIESVVAAALPDASAEVRKVWVDSFAGRTVQEAKEILALKARMEAVAKTAGDNQTVSNTPGDKPLPAPHPPHAN
jgi:hypothetical protein